MYQIKWDLLQLDSRFPIFHIPRHGHTAQNDIGYWLQHSTPTPLWTNNYLVMVNDNLDELIFGSTVPNLFDAIHLALHETIQCEISKLPFPNAEQTARDEGESREERLRKSIINTYTRHMDLAELYATRNLFTISKKEYTKKQRERIYHFYRQLISGSDIERETPKEKNNCDDEHTIEQLRKSKFKNVSDSPSQPPPTVDELNAIIKELEELRIQLRNTKLRRHKLQIELRDSEKKKESATNIKEILSSKDADSIQDQVSGTVIMGKDGLMDLNKTGTHMIDTLNDIKEARGEKKDETVEFGRLMKEKALEAQRPAKKMTLEEDYQNRKNMNVPAGSLLESNLLKEGKEVGSSNP